MGPRKRALPMLRMPLLQVPAHETNGPVRADSLGTPACVGKLYVDRGLVRSGGQNIFIMPALPPPPTTTSDLKKNKK